MRGDTSLSKMNENKWRHLDLFSGIGGFAYAAQQVWDKAHHIVGFSEVDKYCVRLLQKHWPHAAQLGDIRNIKGENIGSVDLITGGFPCQPYSHAGKRKGKEDDRHLWPEMYRVIQETRPTWVIGENVAGFVNMELDQCIVDLESAGYEVEPLIIPAVAVDAPHRRDRVWIVAYTDVTRQRWKTWKNEIEKDAVRYTLSGRRSRKSRGGAREEFKDRYLQLEERYVSYSDSANIKKQRVTSSKEARFAAIGCDSRWEPEPSVGRVAYGIPYRVDRLRGLGNAIVSKVAMTIMRAIRNIEMLK